MRRLDGKDRSPPTRVFDHPWRGQLRLVSEIMTSLRRHVDAERAPAIDGVALLSPTQVDYEDGAELSVLQIVREARDLNSASEELEAAATSWAERYHLCRQRSNFLRALDLRGVGRVLEIGAGCGAITRYLGECAQLVDAVEPMLSRAQVAASRCRDLPGVRVFCGDASSVPGSGEYDLILVCGVLEYVGGTSPDPTVARLELLRRLKHLLRTGGSLVVAIENQLGVKYLVGAPEDHSGRPYDGTSGYVGDHVATTMTRRQISELMAEVDLTTTFLGAFPDYKLTEVVISDELFGREDLRLADRLPRFPSPDWGSETGRSTAEGGLWRTVVAGGLGEHLPNSFVLVSAPGGRSSLIPDGRLATMISNLRRNRYATLTEIVDHQGTVEFRRQRLLPEERPNVGASITQVTESSEFVEGRGFCETFLDAGADERRRLLAGWVQMLFSVAPDRLGYPVDLIPTNLIVTHRGAIVAIDQEWFDPLCPPALIQIRGLAHLARWLRARGAEANVDEIGSLINLSLTDAEVEQYLQYEAEFQTVVFKCDLSDDGAAAALAETRSDLAATPGLPSRMDSPAKRPIKALIRELMSRARRPGGREA